MDKKTLIDYTAYMGRNEPTVSSDVNHETEVHLWNLWIARHRRGYEVLSDRDIDANYWQELVEKQIELYEVQQGVDMELKYGWPNTTENRETALDALNYSIDYLATRIIDTAKEY